LALLRFAPNAKVAAVNAPDEVSIKTDNALTPAATFYRYFNDRAEAIAWLRQP
jgi:hypothetical protein